MAIPAKAGMILLFMAETVDLTRSLPLLVFKSGCLGRTVTARCEPLWGWAGVARRGASLTGGIILQAIVGCATAALPRAAGRVGGSGQSSCRIPSAALPRRGP